MPHTTSPANIPVHELPVEVKDGELVTRYVEQGELAVRYLDLPPGTDLTPVLEGLPGDRCASPHWGLILDGVIHLRHADGSDDTARSGDVYYWPAGHTAWTTEGVRFIEFGPVAEMRQVSEHVKSKVS